MKPYVFPFTLVIVSVLSLALLISPWSLSTQTSSFSLALDLDDSEGDQGVSSLDVSPGQVVPIQIFGSDIQDASSLSARIEYDSTQVVYGGFDAGDVLPDAQVLVEQDSSFCSDRYRVPEWICNGERRAGRHGAFSRHGCVFRDRGSAGAC